MAIQNILAAIEDEISRLEKAKSLLASSASQAVQKATKGVKPAKSAGDKPRKRILSPEAIERIRAAQKKRWAKAAKAKKAQS